MSGTQQKIRRPEVNMANSTIYRATDTKAPNPGEQTMREKGRWCWDSYVLEGGRSREIGSEGATDEPRGYFGCSGVIPGRFVVQGPGKDPGVLTGRAAE